MCIVVPCTEIVKTGVLKTREMGDVSVWEGWLSQYHSETISNYEIIGK